MAARVVVIATDLRRANVTVQPGTYMTDVLAQACTKFGLSSDRYLLKHNKKEVNLGLPFRTAGLPAGAKLELVLKSNTPSAVSVALQIPLPEGKDIPGGRLTAKFPSDTTIWMLLRQFESGPASAGRNLNITGRGVAQTAAGGLSGSGQLFYEIPSLNIMGRELSSFQDFQKTLSQLGFGSGSVLIRLNYRTSDKTFYEATKEISEYFREDGSSGPEATASSSTNAEPVPASNEESDIKKEDVEQPAPLSSAEATEQPAISTPTAPREDPPSTDGETKDVEMHDATDPLKPLGVFAAPSSSTPAAAGTAENDEEYDLSIAQAKSYQSLLEKRGRNQRLLSDKELEEIAAAKKAKIDAVKSVLMRVRFPDNTFAEWSFGTDATGATLYKAVRTVMANPGLSFKLILPIEKVAIEDADSPPHFLIQGYKLQGKVLVTVMWDESVADASRKLPFLSASIAKAATSVPLPAVPDAVEEAGESQPAQPIKAAANKKNISPEDLAKKASKWLKFGKK